jgi:hypothetical protein
LPGKFWPSKTKFHKYSFTITENSATFSTNITITVTLITREKRRIVTRLLRSDTMPCRNCLTVPISISPSLDLVRRRYSLAQLWLCSMRCHYSTFPRWACVDYSQLIGDRKVMHIFQSNWIGRWVIDRHNNEQGLSPVCQCCVQSSVPQCHTMHRYACIAIVPIFGVFIVQHHRSGILERYNHHLAQHTSWLS